MSAPNPNAPPSNLTGRAGISAVAAADVVRWTGRTVEIAAVIAVGAGLVAGSAGAGLT